MRRFPLLIALWLCLLLAGCGIELYSNLTEQDANEIIAELSRGSIRASKESADGKTWSVRVSEGDMPRSLERLKAAALPREKKATMGELFQKDRLVSTPSEERVRYVYAVSEELSRTLSQIDGVVTARVHVVIPANDPLATRVQPSSASVFIKHRANVGLQYLSASIKNLVVKSIEGLTFENVSVSFFPAAVTQELGEPPVPSAKLVPLGLEDAGFTLRDLVFLGVATVGLLVGALIAWRLLRPAAARAGYTAVAETAPAVPKGTR
jgi:type III secretion protein J